MKKAPARLRVNTKLDPDLVEFLDAVFIPATAYSNRSDVLNDLLRKLKDSYKPKAVSPEELPAPIKQKLHG